jgi:hypothetical protein
LRTQWLAGQATSGYIDYHPEQDAVSLSPEQATYLDDQKVAEDHRR